MADGMLTVSYLDTRNRRYFMRRNKDASTRYDTRNWSDAAAPLTVSREAVKPIFRQIEARARQRAYPPQDRIAAYAV